MGFESGIVFHHGEGGSKEYLSSSPAESVSALFSIGKLSVYCLLFLFINCHKNISVAHLLNLYQLSNARLQLGVNILQSGAHLCMKCMLE